MFSERPHSSTSLRRGSGSALAGLGCGAPARARRACATASTRSHRHGPRPSGRLHPVLGVTGHLDVVDSPSSVGSRVSAPRRCPQAAPRHWGPGATGRLAVAEVELGQAGHAVDDAASRDLEQLLGARPRGASRLARGSSSPRGTAARRCGSCAAARRSAGRRGGAVGVAGLEVDDEHAGRADPRAPCRRARSTVPDSTTRSSHSDDPSAAARAAAASRSAAAASIAERIDDLTVPA